ncbi:MAG TPA: hypothetical protein VGG74_05370 [Kofleriaceae bacterium]|jgi:hypothetical protein
MHRIAIIVALGFAGTAHADGVFDVCKGESKTVVSGAGQMSIAVIYPDDFPGRTTRQVLYPIGVRLATAEHAKILLGAEVDAALKLVSEGHWSEGGNQCTTAPSLEAVLGQKHSNITTARASISCDDASKCELHVDLERHGRPSAERFVRYSAPLVGKKDNLAVIAAAAPKLKAVGPWPDAPKSGLAVSELAPGVVTTRSDADGALELDRTMEANSAFAACAPKNRKPHDVRGYWADWKLTALGTAMQVAVSPFGGADPADQTAADCLKKALQHMQLTCPRDGKVTPVRTAICL